LEIKETILAIGTIGTIALSCIVVSCYTGVEIPDSLIFGAFTAIAGLAGFEAGKQ